MLEGLLTWFYDIVWSKPLVYGLLITGVLFSLMMRFFQVRHFKEMIRLISRGKITHGDIEFPSHCTVTRWPCRYW
ncbi:hypothetical protein [Staphylococcus saprophyticus]